MRSWQINFSSYKRIRSLALLAMVICLPLYFLTQLPLIGEIELRLQDLRFRLSPHSELADSSIVLVAIDQESLRFAAQLQQGWPFPRSFYGLITGYLARENAQTIVYDILFDEPDFFRGEEDPGLSDSAFSESMRSAGNCILAFSAGGGKPDEAFEKHALHLSRAVPALSLQGVQAPLAQFCESAAGVGGVSLSRASDSILRSVPAYYRVGDGFYPNLGLAAYQSATKAQHTILYNSKGEIPIFWYGKGGVNGVFKYIPFSALLYSAVQAKRGEETLFPPGYFTGKTILCGATAAGLMDLKSSPYTWGMPGMEAWATLISNLNRGHHLQTPPGWLSLLLIYLIVLLMFIVVTRSSAEFSPFLGLMLLGLILVGSWYCFQAYLIMLNAVSLVLAWVLSWLLILSLSYWAEGKHKRELRLVFSRYLHPDLVDRISSNPTLVQMGGEELNATVLFTDIYDFTKFSEQHQPPELVSYLNEYFSSFTNTILDNHGMLDKYTGDGLMAVFGAPLERSDHAWCACRVALAQRKMGLQLGTKQELSPSEKFHLGTRIGINSGTLVAGNIGSQRRMEYTCIGDPVNLASRLEGVNKLYGTHLILSESTYLLVKEMFIVRELDYVKVKGKDTPTRIYELLDEAGSNEDYSWTAVYAAGLELYRLGDFELAAERFAGLCGEPHFDKPSLAMRERCLSLAQHRPENWEGILILDSK